MVDHRTDFGGGQGFSNRPHAIGELSPEQFSSEQLPFGALSSEQRERERRRLELQLIQARSQAEAARLEAKAAAIELLLQRLDRNQALVAEEPAEIASPAVPIAISPRQLDERPPATVARHSTRTERAKRQQPRRESAKPAASKAELARAPVSKPFVTTPATARSRRDPAKPLKQAVPLVSKGDPASTTEPDSAQRRRPKAVFCSTMMHAGLLILLAFVSLQPPPANDQVMLTAAAVDTTLEPLAAISIESDEPQLDPVEPQASEAEVSLEPDGEPAPMLVEAGVSSMAVLDALSSSQGGAVEANPLSLVSPSAQKTTFCGVEGGGNHFVYLVDCSRSMGAAFESARRELLRSIDALQAHQRFYVIFFDANPDYMRVNRSDADDTESVFATPENKRALQQWAMNIQMDIGKAPYEPLKFAVQLKPDVIFLLSDGEFPEGIATLLQSENRVENLFGDQRIRSIVHTIGYHSQQGEARMRIIAAQNNGQYIHVPKPHVPKPQPAARRLR